MSARLISDMEREATRLSGTAEGFRMAGDKQLSLDARRAALALREAVKFLIRYERTLADAASQAGEA